MEYNQKSLGIRISTYRESRKLTQKQLSALSGVTKSYISNIEAGMGNTVGINKLSRIADALNVSLDDLLCDSLTKKRNEVKRLNYDGEKIMNEISTFTDDEIMQYYKIILAFLEYKKRVSMIPK